MQARSYDDARPAVVLMTGSTHCLNAGRALSPAWQRDAWVYDLLT